MKNINHKSITLGLKTLSILAFAFIFIPFHMAAAQYYNTGGSGAGGYGSGGGGNGYAITYQQAPVYVAPVNPAPVVINQQPTRTAKIVTNSTISTQPTAASTTDTNTNSDLASNAIFGANGFLPSGLVQWILFAIFILLVVILARKVFGAQKRYEEAPLKHE